MLRKLKRWFGFPTIEDYQKILEERLEEIEMAEKKTTKKPVKKAPVKKAPAKKKPVKKKSGGGGAGTSHKVM